MAYDETMLIKLDRRTKEKMRRMKINWSEAVREFINRELDREARFDEAERLRKSIFKKYPGPESTDIIRKARDARHGTGSD
jgi:antibiotic biosynthesis monooxygenase (ABM) superfamily enzyme